MGGGGGGGVWVDEGNGGGERREREVAGSMTEQMGSARRADGRSSFYRFSLSSPLLTPPAEGCDQVLSYFLLNY